MQRIAGTGEPVFGRLFDVMRVPAGGSIRLRDLIQPRIEPEVALVLQRPLAGADLAPSEILSATAFVTPALEIVDSRVEAWNVRAVDMVADNACAARFVIGDGGVPPRDVDLGAMEASLERNGETVATGSMADVMGSPLNAVRWLAAKLSELGMRLEQGDVVLPGSPCAPVPVTPGDRFVVRLSGLDPLEVSFE